MSGAVTLVKLGGSLLTDKRRPETDRPRVVARLAREIGAALASRAELAGRLVLGHGSGSFGHVAAARHEIHRGMREPEQRIGVAITQRQAAELHRRVLRALAEALGAAGTAPFSIAPSSAMVTAGDERAVFALEPLVRALEVGLVPVVYGDVVMDRDQGWAICSTETVFEALVDGLPEHGLRVGRVLWLGETAGVWDVEGRTIRRVSPATAPGALEAVGGSAGTDVTGGMVHRLETALELARRGVVSWIGDGREPGLLERALGSGEAPGDLPGKIPGTWVVPDASR
jgi:isopentenyl phosphate kinase